MIGRTCGRSRSENAGISSESKVRIFTVESLRFPGEGSSAQGKSGPKLRPKGVGDGQQVEIPVLPLIVMREVGTQEDKSSEQLEKLRPSEVDSLVGKSARCFEGVMRRENKYRSDRFHTDEKSHYRD